VLVVPTGIGADMGGYAGDALPVARALASVADVLVTHPNVMNGAMLYHPLANALYVEGWALDEFAAGSLGLQLVRKNRIGLVLDAGIEPELVTRQLQAADASRATLGLDVAAWTMTDQPVRAELALSSSGASWGTLSNPETLVHAARKLVDQAGCTALAFVCRLPPARRRRWLRGARGLPAGRWRRRGRWRRGAGVPAHCDAASPLCVQMSLASPSI
jgi:hypothetical protein